MSSRADEDACTTTDAPRRLAIVGAGRQGARHLAVVRSCASARVVATIDPVAPALHETIPHFASLAEAAHSLGVEGAIICTPHASHYEVSMAALDLHLHVLKEKPFALTSFDAMSLLEHARASGVALDVVAQRLYSYEIQRLAGLPGRPIEVDYHLGFSISPGYLASDNSWRRDRRQGFGVVTDVGYHVWTVLARLGLTIASPEVSVRSAAGPLGVPDELELREITREGAEVHATVTLMDARSCEWIRVRTDESELVVANKGAMANSPGCGAALPLEPDRELHHRQLHAFLRSMNDGGDRSRKEAAEKVHIDAMTIMSRVTEALTL